MKQLPRIAMLGVGSMGGAILAGLRAPGVSVDGDIAVTTRSAASAARVSDTSGLDAQATELVPEANREAVQGARVVILAVKPWLIHDLLDEIAGSLEPDAIVVSVAAGVTTESMQAILPRRIAVVRAMPNTPSLVGLGVTGIAAGTSASDADVAIVQEIFATVGQVLVVDESQINAVAAVSGSGPAYLYLYAEEMTAAAVRLGFDEAEARLLAEQTVVGAAELMRRSGETPAELRRRVTSPKGTTEQAILVMQEAHLGDVYDRALAANIRRSQELEAGN
jgi:pyrroline-5-carboxylate reductase